MSKIFFKMSLGLLAAAAFAWPAGAAPVMKTLTGHVPKIVSQLSPTGSLAGTNHLHLAIGLPFRNQDGLNALLAQINDPASPNYHHYLTPDQFTAQFGPTEKDYQAVADFATANGMTILSRHRSRLLLEVDAPAASAESAFNVKFHTYYLAKENRQFYAPDKEPSVPASLSVLDIQGLNNYVHARPRIHFGPVKNSTTKRGTGPFGSYMGTDFRNAYVPGTSLTGAGQSVALFEYDGYLASDISQYEQLAGLPSVNLTNVLLQGFSGVPFDPNAQGEVTLDIDMVIAMAPGVSRVVVYEGNIEVAYLPNLVLDQIATDNSARQVSSSWGWSGGPSATTDEIFVQMILQGQTFFDASGDVCAFLPTGASGNAAGSVDDPNSENAPSDSPYITQVGATTLQTTGPGGPYASESVWNWGVEFPGQGLDGVGSSGGISGYYSLPSWQQGINMTTNLGSPTQRNTPDVAMPGDNILIIENGVNQPDTAGTSCAAPLWAGFTALINQQAVASGLPTVGFLNPAIYALAKTSSYTNYFRDVVLGNNTWSESLSNFYAVPGYDLCTGLGSPNGTNLINALAGFKTNSVFAGINSTNAVIVSAPVSPWGTNLATLIGGNPNGDWFLFIQDDGTFDSGMIDSGWYVTLTTGSTIGYPADNALTVSTNNVLVMPGSNFSLTVAVTNYGPSISTNVLVTDVLPTNGVNLVSTNATQGVLSRVGTTLDWSFTNLAVNAGATLTLNFTAPIAGTYLNSPTVSASTANPDLNPDDGAAPTVILVAVPTPPVLTVTASPSGQQLIFNVTNTVAYPVVIQASTNLVTWVNIYTNSTMPTSFSYTNATAGFPYRFFRAFSP